MAKHRKHHGGGSYENMSKEELIKIAHQRGIRITSKKTGQTKKKSSLIRALRK